MRLNSHERYAGGGFGAGDFMDVEVEVVMGWDVGGSKVQARGSEVAKEEEVARAERAKNVGNVVAEERWRGA